MASTYIVTGSPRQVNISQTEQEQLIGAIKAAEDLTALLVNLRTVRRSLYRLIDLNEYWKFLEYPPFIQYAERKNGELMTAVMVIQEV